MEKPSFSLKLLNPKYWHTWLGFGLLWLLIIVLPFSAQRALGNKLGLLLGRLIPKRNKITRKNITLCYPNESQAFHDTLTKQSLEAAGRGVFESGAAWLCPRWRLKRIYHIEGLEHLETARAQGQGALFLGIHFTTIEICAAFINTTSSIDGFYRPHRNPVFDYIQRKGRERHNTLSQVIPRDNVRGIVKALKNGRIINYTTDQDFGRKHSIFAPFFGIDTATIPAPSHLLKLGKALAIPYTNGWDEKSGKYRIRIYPPLANFPGDCELTDATRLNQIIETRIRENPGQYLWSHRRFKTRPDGENDFYKVETTRYKKLRDKQKIQGKKRSQTHKT